MKTVYMLSYNYDHNGIIGVIQVCQNVTFLK